MESVFSLLLRNYNLLEVNAIDFILAIDEGSISMVIDGCRSDW